MYIFAAQPTLVCSCVGVHRISLYISNSVTQLTGAVEYTNCFSAEGLDSPNKCPEYDTKQFDGEIPVMLEFWGMRSTPLLPLLLGQLWLEVVAPDMVLSMG